MSELDGHELCNAIAEDYAASARRLGDSLSFEDARRLAQHDLELVDRYEAEAPVPKAATKVVSEEPVEEPEKASQMAAEVGGRLVRREVPKAEPKAIETLSAIQYEKRMKLVRRISMIMQRDDRGDYLHPVLARASEVIHANWTFGKKQFSLARNQKERDQIYFRLLEDLCDRSNGRIRPAWWVK